MLNIISVFRFNSLPCYAFRQSVRKAAAENRVPGESTKTQIAEPTEWNKYSLMVPVHRPPWLVRGRQSARLNRAPNNNNVENLYHSVITNTDTRR